MVESLIQFGGKDAPQLAERLRKKPNDEQAMNEVIQAIYRIAESHQALVQGQNGIAKKYGLLQIQAGGDQSIFSFRER